MANEDRPGAEFRTMGAVLLTPVGAFLVGMLLTYPSNCPDAEPERFSECTTVIGLSAFTVSEGGALVISAVLAVVCFAIAGLHEFHRYVEDNREFIELQQPGAGRRTDS